MAGGMAKYEAYIEIPATYNGIAVTQILSSGFRNLTALQKIDMPDSVKVIGSYAFQDCTGLSSLILPSKLEEINQYAFNGCSLLSGDVIIPATTKLIGKYAFAGTSLTTITLANKTGWKTEPISYIFSQSPTVEIPATANTMTTFFTPYAPDGWNNNMDLTYNLTPTNVAKALKDRVVYIHDPRGVSPYYWLFDAHIVDWTNPTAIENIA